MDGAVSRYKRKQVLQWLRRAALSYRLVVVTAPPGYGKTTLARSLADDIKVETYHFSTPGAVGEPERLWEMLWTELEGQGLAVASTLRRLAVPNDTSRMETVLEALGTVSSALLIFDEYQNYSLPFMDSLVEKLAGARHTGPSVAVFSRSHPEMNLEELQVKGRAAVFNHSLLAFSEAEAREFFQINGVMDPALSRAAWADSEGWIAALRLCLAHCRNSGDAFPEENFEPLVDDALRACCTEEERGFLRQVSLLDVFTASEVASLTGDRRARRRLYSLWRKNAFITFEPIHRTYRMHRLVKRHLENSLAKVGPDAATALYRRAAECHAARRNFMPAYRLLVKAGRDEDILRLLALLAEQGGERTTDCDWRELRSILDAIPWRLRRLNPAGYMAYLWLYCTAGDGYADGEAIREAWKQFVTADTVPPHIRRRIKGELQFLRGFLHFPSLHLLARHHFRAYRLLDGRPFLASKRLSWSFSSPHLSFVYHHHSGEFHRLPELLGHHWEKVVKMTEGAAVGLQLASSAEYHLERGELEKADGLVRDLEGLVSKRDHVNSFLIASFCRARLLLAEGRHEEAKRHIVDSAPDGAGAGMFEHIQCHDLALGYILATAGDHRHLPGWLAKGDVDGPPYGAVHVRPFSQTVYGKILLARGDYDGLAELVWQAPDRFGPFATVWSALHIHIFTAILAHNRRDTEAALQALGAAVDLSRPDGIVFSIAEYGERILPLLRRLRRLHPGDAHLGKITSLCDRIVRGVDGNKNYKKSFLTTREKKIMRLAAKGKTTRAIADTLGVAPVTVKKALSQIYGKLDAHNRADATRLFESLYARTGVKTGGTRNV